MVYKERFVAVLKSMDGRILRERNGVVTLPFGSEYSILLKNLDSRRASVKVSVDGQDTLYGHSLIIDGNSETQLDGVLKGTTVTNRFKFIHKTEQIQSHRGDRADDGIIRIEFAYEQPVIKKTIVHEEHHHYDYYPPVVGARMNWRGDGSLGDLSRGIDNLKGGTGDAPISTYHHSNVCEDSLGVTDNVQTTFTSNARSIPQTTPLEDEGITVPGSKTRQDFRYGSIGTLGQIHTLVLRMTGVNPSGSSVSAPLTVTTKLTCPTCGSKSTSTAKFCASCGTGLES